MNTLAIETHSLSKRYGSVTAVDGISLNVSEGEIYAFLGLNGAGKSTTIRLLLGMVKPTSGAATVLHRRVQPGSSQPWAEVGYLVEEPRAYPELTVKENLEVARRLHPGVPQQAVGEIVETLGLSAYANRRARTLSHGNVQRLGLAKALLHNPRLIILDEPASGLDPAGIVEVREYLLRLRSEKGITIFMSSHILAEVAHLADRIGIIHQGRLLQELSLEELERNRNRRLVVVAPPHDRALSALSSAGYAPELLPDGSISLKESEVINAPQQIASLLVHAGAPPSRLIVEEEALEEYFMRIVGFDAEVSHA
jgi:ABC-2 type transport system ATP-binding protein